MPADVNPVTALFIYQSGAVVISVVYAYIFYKVIGLGLDRFAPVIDNWLEHMTAMAKTQGEILEALRQFNGKG